MCLGDSVTRSIFQPVDATEAFLSYDNGIQAVVMKPEFKGNVADFAIIYPTLNIPNVTEGPVNLFTELNNATKLPRPQPHILLSTDSMTSRLAAENVTVIEQKNVGDYAATILTATDAGDLFTRLTENDYHFNQADVAKMDYYVEQTEYCFEDKY